MNVVSSCIIKIACDCLHKEDFVKNIKYVISSILPNKNMSDDELEEVTKIQGHHNVSPHVDEEWEHQTREERERDKNESDAYADIGDVPEHLREAIPYKYSGLESIHNYVKYHEDKNMDLFYSENDADVMARNMSNSSGKHISKENVITALEDNGFSPLVAPGLGEFKGKGGQGTGNILTPSKYVKQTDEKVLDTEINIDRGKTVNLLSGLPQYRSLLDFVDAEREFAEKIGEDPSFYNWDVMALISANTSGHGELSPNNGVKGNILHVISKALEGYGFVKVNDPNDRARAWDEYSGGAEALTTPFEESKPLTRVKNPLNIPEPADPVIHKDDKYLSRDEIHDMTKKIKPFTTEQLENVLKSKNVSEDAISKVIGLMGASKNYTSKEVTNILKNNTNLSASDIDKIIKGNMEKVFTRSEVRDILRGERIEDPLVIKGVLDYLRGISSADSYTIEDVEDALSEYSGMNDEDISLALSKKIKIPSGMQRASEDSFDAIVVKWLALNY